jgi:hypothetical protein
MLAWTETPKTLAVFASDRPSNLGLRVRSTLAVPNKHSPVGTVFIGRVLRRQGQRFLDFYHLADDAPSVVQ